MLMSWPDGLGTDLHLDGRARDLLTPATPATSGAASGHAADPVVVAAATLHAVTGRERDIQTIEADPGPAAASGESSPSISARRSRAAHRSTCCWTTWPVPPS